MSRATKVHDNLIKPSIWVLAILGLALTGCSNAQSHTDLSGFPQSVDAMSQTQKNEILEFKYLDLSEQDQQVWIDVYAAEYQVGFEKAQTETSIMQMTRSEGFAKTDTHHTTITVLIDLPGGDLEDLKQSQCEKPPLIWAMNNGLTLETTFQSSDTEISKTVTLNRKTCHL